MIIILNNKSHLNFEQYKDYQEELRKIKSDNTLVLCPSSIYFCQFNLTNFILGSQIISKYDSGSYTGEISAQQLKSLGVKYAIVGHSERRIHQNETNEEVKQKILKLISNEITPIICVGESLEERRNNQTKNKVLEELSIIKEIPNNSNILIAYEPYWAVGSGYMPTVEEIDEVLQYIKEFMPDNKVIYGGSVDENNITEISKSKFAEGYLLGGLSLHPSRFQEFLNKIE